ncbi:MAG: 2-phospho-L-lactate guanylyltransferase [Nocardioides sp.]
MSMPPGPAVRFAVLVPVKPPSQGKSRLVGLPDERRTALATAFARDTVTAALAAERVAEVMVVTDDATFAALAAADGCATLPDGVTGDLNGSLVQAALEAGRRWPSYAVAAVCADLPALRAADLDAALAQMPAHGSGFVADARGDGTTAYAASTAELFDPRFGPGSRDAHTRAGAVEIRGDLASLRQDVDDVGDLGRAMVLGVGARTADAMGLGAT